ncbi:hypothetical protein QUB13_26685 [Microcoleus sp. B4-D4]
MRQPAMMSGTLHSVNGVSDKDHSYARQSKSYRIFNRLALTLKPQSVLRIVARLAV